jgi:hypothetical protein
MDPVLHELFSDPVGLLSLAALGAVLLIGVGIAIVVRRKMRDEVA